MSTRILLFILLRLHWSLLDLVHEDARWQRLADGPEVRAERLLEIVSASTGDAGLAGSALRIDAPRSRSGEGQGGPAAGDPASVAIAA
ncbi:MAG: hypothetical protein AAGC67_00450 [Myxococcota bacterium]